MSELAEEVREAVEEAVKDEGQGEVVAERLISWLEAVAAGRESLSDSEAVNRRISVLFDAMSVKPVDDERGGS